jgi:hypothetical protein
VDRSADRGARGAGGHRRAPPGDPSGGPPELGSLDPHGPAHEVRPPEPPDRGRGAWTTPRGSPGSPRTGGVPTAPAAAARCSGGPTGGGLRGPAPAPDVAARAAGSGAGRAPPRDRAGGRGPLAERPERARGGAPRLRRRARVPGPEVARAAGGSDPGRRPRPDGGHRAVRPGAGDTAHHLPGARGGAGHASARTEDPAKRGPATLWDRDGLAGHAVGAGRARWRVSDEGPPAMAPRGHPGDARRVG